MKAKTKKTIDVIAKLVYILVGVSAILSLIWAFTFDAFLDMPVWSIVAIILLIVGGVNWLLVGLSGRDLFAWIKMLF